MFFGKSFFWFPPVFLECSFKEPEIFSLPRLFGIVRSLETFVSCGLSLSRLGIWNQVNLRILYILLSARQADEKYTVKELFLFLLFFFLFCCVFKKIKYIQHNQYLIGFFFSIKNPLFKLDFFSLLLLFGNHEIILIEES